MSKLLPAPALLAIAAALVGVAAPAAHAAEFLVTRADDPAPNGCLAGDCSLREAVAAAAATPEADLIQLQAGQYQLSLGPIELTGTVDIRGAGSDQTRLVGSDADTLLRNGPFANGAVHGMELVNATGAAMKTQGSGSFKLLDITIPHGGGDVSTAGSIGVQLDLVIEQSRIGRQNLVTCRQAQGLCRVTDSQIDYGVRVGSHEASIQILRSLIGPDTSDGTYGIAVDGRAPLWVSDSIVRHAREPLILIQSGGGTAGSALIQRTRFLSNFGPANGNRNGIVSLEDVEFHNHVTYSNVDHPAVLLAEPGPLWRIHRGLIHGNRGGGTDGAAIRLLAGGRVGIVNSTLYDNTFRADVTSGFGHGIGIYNGPGDPAFLLLVHSTLHRGPNLQAGTPGSLLTVRGPSAVVQIVNTVLNGTCAFGGGGSVTNAIGNAESPFSTCQLPSPNNQQLPASQLHLGQLADHGGFTRGFMPGPDSALLEIANAQGCLLAPLDQRGHLRPEDGIGCDIGAMERGAVSDLIFANGLEID